MEAHAFSLRQACVCDILQGCVAKPPAWRRRSHLLADEHLGIHELLQFVRCRFGIDGRELLEIKGVHEDRRAPCQLPQPGRKGVETRAHDRLHSGRKRPPTRRRSSVAVRHQHAGRLDDEEWIAACSLGNLDRFGVGDVAAAGVAHQVNRLVGRQRSEPQHHRVPTGRPPFRALFEELIASERKNEGTPRPPTSGRGQTLDEVEHWRLQAVRVLEDEDHRVIAREAIDHRDEASLDVVDEGRLLDSLRQPEH